MSQNLFVLKNLVMLADCFKFGSEFAIYVRGRHGPQCLFLEVSATGALSLAWALNHKK